MIWSAPSSEAEAAAAGSPAGRLALFLRAAPSQRLAGRIARAFDGLAAADRQWLLEQAEAASQATHGLGYQVALQAPGALRSGDRALVGDWLRAALETCERDGLEAASALLRDFEAFRRHGAAVAPTPFAAVEARLSRFVRGLAGRPLQLAVAAGGVAWTDTDTLFLPPACAGGDERSYRLQAAMLWGQIQFGSFAVDAEVTLAAWPDREHGLSWLAALEAIRIEACIARTLPALGAELACWRGPWPDALAACVGELEAPAASVADSLRWLERMRRDGAAERRLPPIPHAGRLDPAVARAVRAGRIERHCAVLRRAVRALAAGRQAETQQEGGLRPLLTAGGMKLALRPGGEALALPPEASAAARSLLQELGEVPPEALVPAGPGAWTPTGREDDSVVRGDGTPPDFLYDEWDHRRQAYRRDWCRLFEHEVGDGDPAWVPALRRRHAALIARLRRRFEALRGGDRMLRRQPDGDEIDLDALVASRADRRAGVGDCNDVHVRRQRDERSLAVLFMVDMSGSTRGWVNEAEREALVMLGEAVEVLGDAWAVYGFSGLTRSRCDIYRIKTFAEAYDADIEARIAAIDARDYTRMGVAIRHLSRLLAAQPARHRLLVTLSDGRPDDFADAYRGDYGIEDTRRALLEAQSRGIRSYCVTIDRNGADYLSRLYGPARFTVLDDVRKLPLKIADIYRRLAT